MGPRCCRLFHLSRPPPSGNISHLRDRIPGLRGLKDWQWRPSRRQTGDEFSATTKPPEYTGRQFISVNIKIVPARCHLVLDGLIRCVHGCPMSAISEHSCYQPVPILRGFLEKKLFYCSSRASIGGQSRKFHRFFPLRQSTLPPSRSVGEGQRASVMP